MRHRQKLQKTIIVIGAAINVLPFASALACSVSATSELFVNNPSKVLMVDGADRNSTVTIRVRLDSPNHAAFDFGFMDAGLYVPITGKPRAGGTYTFSGGDIIDFVLRYRGSDGLFGTSDDSIYRLSDSANYVRQHYFAPVNPSKSKNSETRQAYFHDLRLNWDLNQDGKPDAHTLIEIRSGRHDGMLPAVTAVPLPPAMWCFGSGLLGLAAVVRGSSKVRSSYG
jgi:hypothetical protein